MLIANWALDPSFRCIAYHVVLAHLLQMKGALVSRDDGRLIRCRFAWPCKDPAETWYLGEIGFFDNDVIPLVKKLKECAGVFGVASDEYLNYAIENRREWEEKGEAFISNLTTRQRGLKKQPIT